MVFSSLTLGPCAAKAPTPQVPSGTSGWPRHAPRPGDVTLVRTTAVRILAAKASQYVTLRWRGSGFAVVVWGDRGADKLSGLAHLGSDATIADRVKEAVDGPAAHRA